MDKEGREGKCALWEEATLPAPWESVCEAGQGSWEGLGIGPGASAQEASQSDSLADSGLPEEDCATGHPLNQPPWDPLRSQAGDSEEVTVAAALCCAFPKHFCMGDFIGPLTLRGRWHCHLHLTDEEA